MAGRNGVGSRAQPGSAAVTRRVRVPKTAELVAGTLRHQIVRGELQEGDTLPSETALMEYFGVSRPTLREAFRVLEAEALIRIHRGSRGGARVQTPNGDVAARYAGLVLEHRGTTLADVYEARAVLEPPCAGILAAGRTDEDLAILWQRVEEAEAAHEDGARAVRIQADFHALIVDLAANETVRVLSGMLWHIIDVATVSRFPRDTGPEEREAVHQGARSHRRLVELIEAKDVEGAERIWRKHLAETSRLLLTEPVAETVLDLLD